MSSSFKEGARFVKLATSYAEAAEDGIHGEECRRPDVTVPRGAVHGSAIMAIPTMRVMCKEARLYRVDSCPGLSASPVTYGAPLGIVLVSAPPHPRAVHGVLTTEAFQVGRPPGRIGGQGTLQGGYHLRRFAHALGVQA